MSESGSSRHSGWDSDLEDVPLVLSDSTDSCSSCSASPRSPGARDSPNAQPSSQHPTSAAARPLQQQQQHDEDPNGGDSTRRGRRSSSGDGGAPFRTPPTMPKLSLAGIGGGPASTPSLSLPQRPSTALKLKPHPLLNLTTPASAQPTPASDVPPTTRGTKPPPLALFGRGPANNTPPESPGDGPPSPTKRTQQQHQHRRQQQQERQVRVQLLLPAFEFDVPPEAQQQGQADEAHEPRDASHGSMVGASVRDAIVRALGVSSAYLRYFDVKELPPGQLPGDLPVNSHRPSSDSTDSNVSASEPPCTSRRHHTSSSTTTGNVDSRHDSATSSSSSGGSGDCTVAVAVAHSTFTLQTLEGLLGRGARDAAEIAGLKQEAAAREEAFVLAKVAAAEKTAEVERLKAQLTAQRSDEAARLLSATEHERRHNAALQTALLQLRRDYEGLRAQLGVPQLGVSGSQAGNGGSDCNGGTDGSGGREGRVGNTAADDSAGRAGSSGSSALTGRCVQEWDAGAHLRGVDSRLVDALTSLSKPGVLDKMARIIAHMERSNSSSGGSSHMEDGSGAGTAAERPAGPMAC